MSKVRTLSRTFMSTHPRKGQDTHFVEKVLTSLGIDYTSHDYFILLLSLNPKLSEIQIHNFYQSLSINVLPKHHTIRGGNHFAQGDKISLRVWSAKPYNSKQIIIAPDIEVKKVWIFEVTPLDGIQMPQVKATTTVADIAKNDGLELRDFYDWFQIKGHKCKKPFVGQVICWSDQIEY